VGLGNDLTEHDAVGIELARLARSRRPDLWVRLAWSDLTRLLAEPVVPKRLWIVDALLDPTRPAGRIHPLPAAALHRFGGRLGDSAHGLDPLTAWGLVRLADPRFAQVKARFWGVSAGRLAEVAPWAVERWISRLPPGYG